MGHNSLGEGPGQFGPSAGRQGSFNQTRGDIGFTDPVRDSGARAGKKRKFNFTASEVKRVSFLRDAIGGAEGAPDRNFIRELAGIEARAVARDRVKAQPKAQPKAKAQPVPRTSPRGSPRGGARVVSPLGSTRVRRRRAASILGGGAVDVLG